MTEGTDKYTWQQNIVIPYNQIVGDSYDNSDPPILTRNQQVPLNGDLYNYQSPGKFLSVNFTCSLNPPNQKMKRFHIKNINSCLTSAGGYLWELECPDLLRYPIQFLDSQSSGLKHEEYINNKSLNTLQPRFKLSLISGSIPYSIVHNNDPNLNNNYAYFVDANGEDTDTSNAAGIEISSFLINPSFSFSIIYEYF